MWRVAIGVLLTLAPYVATTAIGQSADQRGVPSPQSVLGFHVGTDKRLADWNEITTYLGRLAAASDRIRLDTLGTTTLDRPFIALTISSPRNLARLGELLEIQRRLADPRLMASEKEASRLFREGRVIVLITGGIHSTEVGAYQVPMRIAYELAVGKDASTAEILDEVVLLLVPSLNPDGSQMVVDWYERTLGKPWEGANPPFLYHHYVGHDNNRDWYAFTQKETRLVVEKLHNVWHPQIVHDIHQMGAEGPRFFVPPWIDPIEPNVDPLLVAGINAVGTDMAWEMYGEGKTGIVVNAIYDAWTPARAYQHYHGGVRILTETASARLASPIAITFDSLEERRGIDPKRASWNHPEPWPGGVWRLADIVDYMDSGALALLHNAARYRERWLSSFYRVGLRAIAGRENWPRAFVISGEGQNADGLPELLRILISGDVEVRRAGAAFELDGRRYEAGAYVIRMDQPYAAFAKTLLERQHYPELREYSGGPLRVPYDVTAHTLPLMMEVEVAASAEIPEVELSEPIDAPAHEKRVSGLTGLEGGRIALYDPWVPSIDAGWTRWLFDEYGIGYHRLRDDEVRAGDLERRFAVIILPDMAARAMLEGHRPDSLPAEYTGGLGRGGVAELGAFVQDGGTLIAFNRGSTLPIQEFGLPVADVLAGLERNEFFVPGSILRLEMQRGHWLTEGLPARSIAWFEEGPAFQPTAEAEGRVEIVGRFGNENPLLSGWISGAEHIAGRGAIAVVRYGRGLVILFAFRPQYRGQTIATYPLIFNALEHGLARRDRMPERGEGD